MKVAAGRLLPAFYLLLLLLVTTVGTFAGGVWASTGIGGAIIMSLIVWFGDRRLPLPQTDLAVLVLAALLSMAALNCISSAPQLSWALWVRLVSIFLPLLFLSSPAIQAKLRRSQFAVIIVMTAAAAALALSLELFLHGPLLKMVKGAPASLTEYNRGISYLVLLAFPIMAGVRCKEQSSRRRRLVSALFVLALLIPASLTESRAAKLALVLGLAAMIGAQLWPIVTTYVLGVLPLLLLGWPFAAQKVFLSHYDWLAHFPDSWRDRMEIWDYMSYRILEHPWLGWGLGTSHLLDFQQPHGSQYVFRMTRAMHPHNVVTQLWVELGLPGLALGLAFAFVMLSKAYHLHAKIRPFALGSYAAALTLSLVAYDFWTDSLFAAFALTGLAFSVINRRLARVT
jgi:O-antigen ligase